jgi:hypothetical protein
VFVHPTRMEGVTYLDTRNFSECGMCPTISCILTSLTPRAQDAEKRVGSQKLANSLGVPVLLPRVLSLVSFGSRSCFHVGPQESRSVAVLMGSTVL